MQKLRHNLGSRFLNPLACFSSNKQCKYKFTFWTLLILLKCTLNGCELDPELLLIEAKGSLEGESLPGFSQNLK